MGKWQLDGNLGGFLMICGSGVNSHLGVDHALVPENGLPTPTKIVTEYCEEERGAHTHTHTHTHNARRQRGAG